MKSCAVSDRLGSGTGSLEPWMAYNQAMRRPLVIALLAGCLPAQGGSLQDEVQAALEKARPRLMQQLSSAQGGRLALVCLAAIHDEVPRDNEVFVDAMQRLSKTLLADTYELSLRLMVMAEYQDFPDLDRLARVDLQKLLGNRSQGGFTYNSSRAGGWDLSNTQYGALGLRAGESLGFRIPTRTWTDLLRAVARSQSGSGGFDYAPGSGAAPYASMTVAGIAVLQICKQALGRQLPTSVKTTNRLKAAWTWMERNVRDIGDPATKQSYYFHYGLERAAILSDVIHVKDEDWYELGARMFVDQQLADGGWGAPQADARRGGRGGRDGRGRRGAPDLVSTSFAVLFLQRKFQKVMAPITPGGGIGISQLDDNSSEADINKVVERELAKGIHVVPNMLKEMRSKVVARRKAAVKVVSRLSGNDFGFNPYGDEERNREALKAAELWWLKSRRSGGRGGNGDR